MTIIEKALQIAAAAHKEQVRKSDGSPYIAHPVMVAWKLAQHGFSDEVVAAALVHDVLEDTDVSESELRSALGDTVVDMVTAVSEDQALPWEERKTAYIAMVVAAGEGARAISVADKIHNAESLLDAHAEYGPAIWEKFNRGKDKKLWFERTLCTELQKVWQHPLLDEYHSLVTKLGAL